MGNSDHDAARLYHEVTKHSYTSVRSNAYGLDWNNRPLPYKIYPAAGAIALPRELELSPIPATSAIAAAVRHETAARIDVDALTRILFCAGGLTRSKTVGGEAYHFRAAASAGALYPIETYLAAIKVEGIEPGLYHFSPADLKLRGLRRGDWNGYIARAAATRPSLADAHAVILLSAIFWRSAWKYRARAYRYCFWDAGTILANLMAAANAEGIAAEIVTAFEDAPLEGLLDIDGEREGAVCLVALGRRRRASEPVSPGSAQPASLNLDTVPLSAREVVYEDLVKVHRASRLESAEQVHRVAGATLSPEPSSTPVASITPAVLPASQPMGLGETIVRRGSTRVFAREPITAEELATIMATSRAPLQVDFPAILEPYVIVNAVDGVEPGVYRYRRDNGSFELLRSGEFRGEAGYLCLEQPLGADCSALICYMAKLEHVLDALGNRGYRDAHLEAGILGGRAYLAAYSLGRGASGLTFYDDDCTNFFAPDEGKSPILMVAIGVPQARSSAAEEESD